MLGAADDEDLVGRAIDPPVAGEVARDGLPERIQPLGLAILHPGAGQEPEPPAHDFSPEGVGKSVCWRNAVAKIITKGNRPGRGEFGGRVDRAIPVGRERGRSRPQWARGVAHVARPDGAGRGRDVVRNFRGNKCPRPPAALDIALGYELVIGREDGVARDARLQGESAARGQAHARCETARCAPPRENGRPDGLVDALMNTSRPSGAEKNHDFSRYRQIRPNTGGYQQIRTGGAGEFRLRPHAIVTLLI